MTKFHVSGVCHIDLAWLSDADEYECYLEQLTLVLLDLLEQYPDMTYEIEQAYHYRQLAKHRPDLFRRVTEMLALGRLEFVGGMASTMETNIPCGESFVRNQLMGLNWVESEMSASVNVGWMVDTFGINAQVPQVLSQFGIRALRANRFGGEKTRDIFYAEGLDGTKLLVCGRDVMSRNLPPFKQSRFLSSHVPHGPQVDALFNNALACKTDGDVFLEVSIEDEYMPNRRMMRDMHAFQKTVEERGDEASFSLPGKFFEALRTQGVDFPTVPGDLNPEFTGTFSQRIEIRLENRKTEFALLEAEKWLALMRVPRPQALKDAWWDMFFVHFHDVFTGSHPDCVFQDVLRRLHNTQKLSAEAILSVLCTETPIDIAEGDRLLVSNGIARARTQWMRMPQTEQTPYALLDETNRPLPCVYRGDETWYHVGVDACAARAFTIGQPLEAPSAARLVTQTILKNEYVRLTIDEEGVTLVNVRDGSVILDCVRDLLVLQRDEGGFQMESPIDEEIYAWTNGVQIYDDGTVEGEYPGVNGETSTKWKLRFRLFDDDPLVYIQADVDWHATAKRLRLKLHTALHTDGGAMYEVPFGVVRRTSYPAGTCRKGEWPAQRFVAVEDGRRGLALINKGVPGVEVLSSMLYTTLLRAPSAVYANMKPDSTSSQHGEHTFAFALYPYDGCWQDAAVPCYAQDFNEPMLVNKATSASEIPSMMSIDCDNVLVSAVKEPEDGTNDLILRIYETAGRETDCTIYIKGMRGAQYATIRERAIDELECDNERAAIHLSPFQIRTIRVER